MNDVKPDNEHINLKVVGQDGGVVHLKIKKYAATKTDDNVLRTGNITYWEHLRILDYNYLYRFINYYTE